MPPIPELKDAPRAGPASRRTLPSGRSIILRRPRGFDATPWEVAGSGGMFRVRRERRGNSAEYEYAKDAAGRALELTEEDARALLAMFNRLLEAARDVAGARRSARTRRSA